MEKLQDLLPMIVYIGWGLGLTLQYTLISVFIGFWLGLALALMKLSRFGWTNCFANFYISLFRGTPLLVQLSIIYFGFPALTGVNLNVFSAGVITFSLNSAAYVAEVIRSGIQSVDKSQFETAQALRIPSFMMWRDIILPQAMRNILPALINEIINMLKETALISVLGGADIMRRAQLVAAERYSYLQPLIIAAVYYYILVMIFSSLAKFIERKMNYY